MPPPGEGTPFCVQTTKLAASKKPTGLLAPLLGDALLLGGGVPPCDDEYHHEGGEAKGEERLELGVVDTPVVGGRMLRVDLKPLA